jgi:hypothetical protein
MSTTEDLYAGTSETRPEMIQRRVFTVTGQGGSQSSGRLAGRSVTPGQRKDYPLGGIPVEYKGAVIPPPDERRSYS